MIRAVTNLSGNLYLRTCKQCLRIRNDLSGSVSSYEFLELRIRICIYFILFEHIGKLFFKSLKFNQKEKSVNYLPFSISHYSTLRSPESSGKFF